MERGDDRGLERMIAPDVFSADQAAAQKPCRLIVQLLGDLCAHAPPGGRIGFDLVRIHDGLHCWKMFRQARFTRSALFGAAVRGDRFFQFSLQGGGDFFAPSSPPCSPLNPMRISHGSTTTKIFRLPLKLSMAVAGFG